MKEYEELEQKLKSKDDEIALLKEKIEEYRESILHERKNRELGAEDIFGEGAKKSRTEIDKLCKELVTLEKSNRILNEQLRNLKDIHEQELQNIKRSLKDALREKDSLKEYLKLLEDKIELVLQREQDEGEQPQMAEGNTTENLFRFISNRNQELALEKDQLQVQLRSLQNMLNSITLDKKKQIMELKNKLEKLS